MQLTDSHKQYWQKNIRVTGLLLVIWFVVTYVVSYMARDLSFTFFGQGSLVIYVLLIAYYAHYMNNLDKEYDCAEVEED
jgi:putative solute:sodium symporter small subunit